MNATAVHAMMPSTLVSESSSFCSGDRVRLTEVSIVAICPIWVCIPVAVTTIDAVPRVTDVFWNNMFDRSPSATSAPGSTPGSFATGALSPVSAASWVSSVAERRMRPSAGTMSPASTCTRSPGTTSRRGNQRERAVAHNLGLRNLQARERGHARPRLQLLAGAEHHVEQDEQRHDDARSRSRRSRSSPTVTATSMMFIGSRS